MSAVAFSRLARVALTASCIALTVGGGAAHAQAVRVFDEAPPVEVLRGIMIPESVPGATRSIVMERPDAVSAGASSQRVVPVSAQAAVCAPAPPRAPAADAGQDQQASPARATPNTEAKPGTVGFRINFAFNSASLPESAHAMIDTVAQVLLETPGIKVRVEGHTDAAGGAKYNLGLSERRALAVGAYLVKRGISPSRIVLVGKGMSEPLVKDPYDAQNRRVQFVRLG